MGIFTSEFVGTALLILLGNGVVANVVLKNTKGNNSGWIVITFGWAMAVFVGVFATAKTSGAHLNPAITFAFAYLGKVGSETIPQYLGGQMLGAMAGQLFVYLTYRQHYLATEDTVSKLASFSTIPQIRGYAGNFLTEGIATFAFVLAVLFIVAPANSLGAIDALPVAFVVLAVGLSLGGPTGYAINPARDLGPRIMHAILPIGKKGITDWAYSWVPVMAPIVGGLLAAIVFKQLR